uniref:N-acetyltransferase domain-containing protein n=1 Tax=Steinernema glaseri TaxID=37863 RepID=A0A1I7ZXU2_9BILA
MGSTVLYRKLNFSDLEAYKKLMAEEYPNGYIGILFKDITSDKAGIYYRMGAFVNEELVGILICVVNFLAVRSYSDLENGLRQGIGSALLKGLFDTVKSTIFFHVPAINVNAQHFFEASGCNAKSTIRRYFADNEDAILYARE